jgi:hypothetical protein
MVARGLEGRWRARLGDLAGAALSFARLRELASSLAPGDGRSAASPQPGQRLGDDPRTQAVAGFLREAADVERTRLHDPLAAQRHVAAALRLRPRDAELLRAYRDLGTLVARDAAGPESAAGFDDDAAGGTDVPPPFDDDEEKSATHRTLSERPPLDLSLPAEVDAELAGRIDDLTRRLQGNPADDAVADELATLLEQAGRGHELLALLSARIEDATPERRIVLAPMARGALERLAHEAEAAGRHEEAALYRGAIAALLR